MCLGPTKSVYELDLASIQLSPLPGLRVPRAYAGVAKNEEFVYIFGGQGQGMKVLNSCEKYSLRDKLWLSLGNMQFGRCEFTPCPFQANIYLLSPKTTLKIEKFSTETDVFAQISVPLPGQLQSPSVSFISNGELYLLTDSQKLGCWKVESREEFRVSDTNKRCWSSQLPLVVGSVAYIAYGGAVERFSLETFAFT